MNHLSLLIIREVNEVNVARMRRRAGSDADDNAEDDEEDDDEEDDGEGVKEKVMVSRIPNYLSVC